MNSKSGSESSGTFTWGVIAGIVALVGAGGLYLSGIFGNNSQDATPQPDVAVQTTEEASPAPTSSPAAEDQAQPDAEPETTETASDQDSAEPAPAAEQTAEVDPGTTPPTLDQIFVEPDGNTVLSGNAEPGADVRVLLDGEQVHSFTVDDTGQFAEFLSIPFSEDARGLTLETAGEDQPVRSDDYLIAALPDPQPDAQEVASAEATETAPSADAPEASDEGTSAQETTADATALPETEVETAEATPEPSEDQAEQTTDEVAEEAEQNQQVAILRSGEDGVELVQPPSEQGASDEVALDTIGYSDAGDVELTGRVPDGSAVRLYLDNQLVADLSPVDDGKWRSELEGIDPGVYTLRVDEVASDGTVASRLETPFKREPLEVLRAAEGTDAPEAEQKTPPIRSVTVQEGDTLWAISRDRFGDGILYVRLFEANRDSIRDPDLIYPGQIFTIPE
ncbi:LysM peptidoglycan-binding domain-containing protein [Ruegeria sp. Ofav3-42]|uniref:LysM peptidoglycan-binding domain-containing protein n=1 Tax=Ruegeria sp. Ofav3-42 TaxID=2917759 RepID=UPI001EF71AC2|nr:LysM peptidoglycan-binding domain-containing protein [Ruegeria sp. Ofav3-42]MCG7521342.1 LysM peptidoglycan-binding domain-containing protein [Ruegeria sp. Ofav3-42]